MPVTVHNQASASFPAFPKERLSPQFPPSWSTVFGDDDYGIFAKVEGLDFEFRWIMPQLIEAEGFPSKFVEGFWLAEKAISRESGNWGTIAVKEFIKNCAVVNECPIRLPTHTELLAARETLRFVEADRKITLAAGQIELCTNDTKNLGLNNLDFYEILVDTLNLQVLEASKTESANPLLRLAIQAS